MAASCFGGLLWDDLGECLSALADDLVGTAGEMQGFGIVADERLDMAHALLVVNLLNGDEDTCLFHVAEAIVDGRAEHLHGWREGHIGVDEWRDIESFLAYLSVQSLVVFLELRLVEYLRQLAWVFIDLQRLEGYDEVVLVAVVFVEETENEVSAMTVV